MTTTEASSDVDLDEPALYTNRDVSLLEFQERVLEQAKDPSTPLLERLRFLTICSSNLDEYFEIRVAGLKQQVSLGVEKPPGADGESPRQLLERIGRRAHEIVEEQYRVLNDEILPALAEEEIRVLPRDAWSPELRGWLRDSFMREVAPVLTPMAIDPAHPFPRVANKSLNFLVRVRGRDAFGRNEGMAVVTVPRSLPRMIPLPADLTGGGDNFAMLSSVVHAHVGEMFPGMEVEGCYQFRITRNSDLWVEEEEIDDLLRALEGELPRRNYGDSVRLEIADNCPEESIRFLLEESRLEPDYAYQVNGPVNLSRLAEIYRLVRRPDLKFRPFQPGLPEGLNHGDDVFAAISRRDILLHHPYQSFGPVVDLVRQAAKDPAVLAIKQTLYRTGSESALVDALIEASLAGKEVTVVVELRARFDEEANIDLATQMQEAGVNVAYGIVGYKTHAKLLMVVRREEGGVRRYCHLGTGNYHIGTARAYSDLGLLTAEPRIGEDVHQLFLQLTGIGQERPTDLVIPAPFRLHGFLLDRVQREIDHARAGRPSGIAAKMNALTSPSMVRAFYEASCAGVQVDLIVRGACCLKPGLPGVSENVRVRSIVGRFLEHHRVYRFENGGEPVTLAASADLMSRNLLRRVEACFPILDPELAARVNRECLTIPLQDNTQTWELGSNGRYTRLSPGDAMPRESQRELLEALT
jgi:polyphosphate kinase